MSDVTAGGGPAISTQRRLGGLAFLKLGEFGALLRRGDIALAIGVLSILVVLILPLPPLLLDLSLAISITSPC